MRSKQVVHLLKNKAMICHFSVFECHKFHKKKANDRGIVPESFKVGVSVGCGVYHTPRQ